MAYANQRVESKSFFGNMPSNKPYKGEGCATFPFRFVKSDQSTITRADQASTAG
jgi:hypothetical protein